MEQINGSIERITYHNSENGFCVLRIKAKGNHDLITIIGNAPNINNGEFVEAEGYWITDKIHGRQFKAVTLKLVSPTTLDGMQKYLGSGMIKGIGPHFAKKLIKAFGLETFDIIEKDPKRLRELGGIGQVRAENIQKAWSEQKVIRHIMVFLQSHGVGTTRATRIFKTYGQRAIELISENPYRLATDISGIGFKTADTIASTLGIKSDSLLRARAGVLHVLQELCTKGHCAATVEELKQTAAQLLNISEAIITTAISEEINTENLIADTIDDKPVLFPATLYQCEISISKNLNRLNIGKPKWGDIHVEKALPWVEQQSGFKLSPSQQIAVTQALQNKIFIITGGPGVGKTTIVKSVLAIIKAKGMQLTLCSPTGRAAKRLSETTGMEATTIHRLLEFDPKSGAFKHNATNTLMTDMIVVDEASMLDVVLFNHLIKAIPNHASLLLVGDIDQLPSVGSGAILSDLIQSEKIPTARLTEIYRQAAESKIITNSHRINNGEMPLYPSSSDKISDFYVISAETPEEICHKIIHLVSERIPQKFAVDPIRDIQVLTPMNRSGLGTIALNVLLQEKLNNNATPKISRFGATYSPGDKVIQNSNNYDKEVFNGDIGFIKTIDLENGSLIIDFDGREIEYELNELDEISLAYATSIHKSQGSEYPVVVIPLSMQHYMMLSRNLLYTAVTRGKKLVIIVGETKSIAMAVNNNKSNKRLTNLCSRIQNSLD